MFKKNLVSKQTQRNWWVDAVLLVSALLACLSGIYFLFLPNGGYRGGRNPWADVQILFARSTWDDLHTWSGVAMIAIVVIHLTLHWSWITGMVQHTIKELRGQCGGMNLRCRINMILDAIAALSFLLVTTSGIYLLFFPGGRGAVDPQIIFSRTTWDLVHTWSGVLLIITAAAHFALHWNWVVKMCRCMATSRPTAPTTLSQAVPGTNH